MKLKLSEDTEISNFHTLVVANSGAGKTNLTLLMMCLLAKELYDMKIKNGYKYMLVIDAKKASLYSTRYSVPHDGAETYAHDSKSALKLLKIFYAEIERRSELLDDAALDLDADYKTLELPPCWLIFDEFIDCIESAKIEDTKLAKEIQLLLVRSITKGRQLGCFIWITMIRADTTYLSGAIRSTMTKILLCDRRKEADADGARMLFNTADLPKPSKDMRFYCYIMSDSNVPRIFLTPCLDHTLDVRELLQRYLA